MTRHFEGINKKKQKKKGGIDVGIKYHRKSKHITEQKNGNCALMRSRKIKTKNMKCVASPREIIIGTDCKNGGVKEKDSQANGIREQSTSSPLSIK